MRGEVCIAEGMHAVELATEFGGTHLNGMNSCCLFVDPPHPPKLLGVPSEQEKKISAVASDLLMTNGITHSGHI